MKKIIELEKILEEQKEENLNHYFIAAYLTAKRFDLEGFVFDDCGFDYDVEEIIENLERFNINKIVVTELYWSHECFKSFHRSRLPNPWNERTKSWL